MPVEGPLPGTGIQHDINADATRCLMARHPQDWRLQSLEGTDDYGYDFQVQTTPNQQATDIFRIQLKGTRSPIISADGEYISVALKATTVRYYARGVEPVLLVICDLSVDEDPVDCPLYYAWLSDELRRIKIEDLPVDQKSVTLRAPITNRLKRTTDLSKDIRYQNELSHAGHTLALRAEHVHPEMQADDRLLLVQGVIENVATRPALMDALAGPTVEYWVNPARDTLAWNLTQARADLRVNALEQALAQLDQAESKLENSKALELAEYWCLRGNWQVETGGDQAAISAYQKAYQANPLPKYLAARVEAEVRVRFDHNKESLSELHDLLEGDDPAIVATRSRLYAVQGNYDLALETAARLPEPQKSFTSAFAHWLAGELEDTLTDCEAGLAACSASHETRQLLLLFRARAKFSLAVATASTEWRYFIPPAGLPGVELQKLEDAWSAITEAVLALKAVGWDSNIEHLADIWAATASALGRAESILPDLIDATRTRPRLPNIHEALRAIAGQLSNFELALSANDRLPDSPDKRIWNTLLLYETGKFRACWQSFASYMESLDRSHPLFGPATIAACLSAHKSIQPGLVKQWMDILESHPDLRDQAALAQFYLKLDISRLSKDEALNALLTRYEELEQPLSLALTLFHELDPTDHGHASICVRLSKQITEHLLLSPTMAARLGLALVTLDDWPGLLELCQSNKVRVDPGDRMGAFEALALDYMGETEQARDRLLALVASGSSDQLALNTYVTIATRCGYVSDAIEAAERVLESAKNQKEQLECIKLLFTLIQFAEPASDRLIQLALRAGDLVDQSIEAQEGTYLMMHLSSSLAGGSEIDLASDREQFRTRADAFFKRFPDSRMLRRGEIREDSSATEMMESLKALAGITPDREAFQRRLEYGLKQGFKVVPFTWRPRLVLSSVCDVLHLWEIAKVSSRDDRQYHLVMQSDLGWQPPDAESLRQRVPLLDWTALLVLYDLGLIEEAIGFFGRIGIAKATMEELAEFTNPLFGSPYREKCLGLQKALQPYLGSVLQPSAQETMRHTLPLATIGRGNAQIVEICATESDRFRLYSDDQAFRVFCAGESDVDGICTLDVLAALVEVGQLTPTAKAQKIAQLCEWRVGVVVRLPDIVLLLPPALLSARGVSQGVEILDAAPGFVSVISALWDYASPYEQALQHAAAVLRALIGEQSLSDVALAALMRQWYVKAAMKKDAPGHGLETITLLIITAALMGDLTQSSANKAWCIYRRLVEAHHGPRMDEALEIQAIRSLGVQCAKLETIEPGEGLRIFTAFNESMTSGTRDQSEFSSAYSHARIALARSQDR
ncbi:DUF4365 domain-containing protein [Pseudomonas sp. NPDC078416]|uniref:DUF4365 domain-containing protein n=1 Tax=Pseudomonas sp. NPDC078416 TaxID=3390637 RepID=UPI003D021E2B